MHTGGADNVLEPLGQNVEFQLRESTTAEQTSIN